MAVKIQSKHSATKDKAPQPTDLVAGELAVNIHQDSPAIYLKDSAGAVRKLAGVGAEGSYWGRTGTAVSPSTTGDTVQISAGTGALPGLTPVGDPNTGVFSAGADQIGLATNGTGRLFVDASGRVGIGSASSPVDDLHISATSPSIVLEDSDARTDEKYWRTRVDNGACVYEGLTDAFGNPSFWLRVFRATNSVHVDNIQFATSGSERLRIDSSGRLLVGTSSSIGNNTVESINTFGLYRFAASSVGPFLNIGKSRATTTGINALVSSGDSLGTIAFTGGDGTSYVNSAWIRCEVDGTPGSNDMPGRLMFSTANGASDPTDRMTIKSTGIVNIVQTPVHADNTAAKAGGLVAGDIYRKADGTLMITF